MVRSNANRWPGVGISLPPYRMRSPACRQHSIAVFVPGPITGYGGCFSL